ncbi:MAG: sigma 54-interacting transcriptional regulator [Nitrospirae bacterium]|nr:sigma 54-interacting transcriptional regulator [Nitrospirota bacterium]
MKKKILVIDDEESLRYTFETFLTDEGYEVATAESFDEALARIADDDIDLIFADILLGDKTGIDLLREIRSRDLTCPVVMVTGFPNLETAAEALRLGAFDYIAKPVTQRALLHAASLALKHKDLLDENRRIRTDLEAIFRSVRDGIITVDPDMRVIEMNNAAEAICGLSRDKAHDRQIGSLPNGCLKQCVEALAKTIKEKETVELYHIDCQLKGRERRVVNITTSPLIGHHNEFSGAVMVLSDETRIADLESDMGERRHFFKMIGKSEQMQNIYSLLEQVADFPATVLIRGESGTGKELVAEALHYQGIRGTKSLVKVNCSSLPENLLESELFGHVKGAFTGAISDRIGRFQLADKGTIFLDEIGDMPQSVQMRLLRVLQEREFERVGDATPIRVDVRVIAATNKNLVEKIQKGEFREDLYYRLKVVEVVLPALRQRKEDIPLLISHFIQRFSKKFSKNIRDVSADVRDLFMQHDWPGNIRELEHVIEHACILCKDGIITDQCLPKNFIEQGPDPDSSPDQADEREKIMQALRKAGGNKAKAARLLGVSRRTMYRRIEDLNIPDITL